MNKSKLFDSEMQLDFKCKWVLDMILDPCFLGTLLVYAICPVELLKVSPFTPKCVLAPQVER